VREQTVLMTALTELRKMLPFSLLGFDTDNDSVFMIAFATEWNSRAADLIGKMIRPLSSERMAPSFGGSWVIAG
jgi:hypothetical protein